MRGLWIAAVAFAGSCSAAFSQEAYSPLSTATAQRRLEAYVDTWSANNGINAANVSRYYADRVIYYGKPMSRQQVLRDKLNYIAVWPERYYHIVPGRFRLLRSPTHSLPRVRRDGVGPALQSWSQIRRQRTADANLVAGERRQDCA